jgi:hypothetical protein
MILAGDVPMNSVVQCRWPQQYADGALKAAEIAMKGRKNFRNWLF